MRSKYDLPKWMTHPYIIGFETDPAGGTGDAGAAGDQSQGGSGSGGTGDKGDDQGKQTDENLGTKEDVTGLKAALAAERETNKANAKKLAAAERREQDLADKDKTEVEKAKADLERSTARTAKLAEGFKRSALNSEIEKAARAAKFIDPDDAYRSIDLSAITVEQDDDDPADVKVDSKAVKALVEALAKKKPYLVGGEAGGDPSGSKFGGGKSDKKVADTAALMEKYSALR